MSTEAAAILTILKSRADTLERRQKTFQRVIAGIAAGALTVAGVSGAFAYKNLTALEIELKTLKSESGSPE